MAHFAENRGAATSGCLVSRRSPDGVGAFPTAHVAENRNRRAERPPSGRPHFAENRGAATSGCLASRRSPDGVGAFSTAHVAENRNRRAERLPSGRPTSRRTAERPPPAVSLRGDRRTEWAPSRRLTSRRIGIVGQSGHLPDGPLRGESPDGVGAFSTAHVAEIGIVGQSGYLRDGPLREEFPGGAAPSGSTGSKP